MATSKDLAKALLLERDQIDEKIAAALLVLEVNNSTMDSPLVDSEGYPLNSIDVYAVRHARHDIVCLRNDRQGITEKIAEHLENMHQSTAKKTEGVESKEEPRPVHRTSNKPFAKVTQVTADSPAALGRIQKGDEIIQYGSLHADNFDELKQVAQITSSSEGKVIRVTVLRNDRAVRLEITPRKWSGPGLLGCVIQPLSG